MGALLRIFAADFALESMGVSVFSVDIVDGSAELIIAIRNVNVCRGCTLGRRGNRRRDSSEGAQRYKNNLEKARGVGYTFPNLGSQPRKTGVVWGRSVDGGVEGLVVDVPTRQDLCVRSLVLRLVPPDSSCYPLLQLLVVVRRRHNGAARPARI